MTLRLYILLGILVVLAVILMVWLVRNPLLFRAAPASPNAGLEVRRRETSILYEVFKPVIDPYNATVEYFRPSNLREVACSLLPSRPERLPFSMLFGLARGCY